MMKKNREFAKKRSDYHDEFDRYLEKMLNQEELDDLEQRLSGDEEARGWFAEYLHLHAVLQADGEELLSEDNRSVIEFPVYRRWLVAMRYAAAVAFLLGCGWLLRGSFSGEGESGPSGNTDVAVLEEKSADLPVAEVQKEIDRKPEEKPAPPSFVATLADTRECKWAGSSLPTTNGARLAAGQLHLLEGLATVVFDGGAQVTMEAPAVMEVVSAKKCRLVSGGLVGWVRDGAEGFQVETDDAMVTDYGTRFGVMVGESGRSEVVVLEGEVGVEHSRVKGEKLLEMGEAVRYDAKSFLSEKEPGGIGVEPDRNGGLDLRKRGRGWKAITTAEGLGKDTFVRYGDGGGPFGRGPLVMAKLSADRESNQRKTYLGFDLGRLGGAEVREAELVLEIRSSGLGYASVVPDSTFRVYGLLDESLDGWDELNMTWAEAPANVLDDGFRLQDDKVVELGKFEIKQGVSSGFRSVEGAALSEFLNRDSNGIATLIVVRETDQTAVNGLVHAFASREHPTAMAPTLRVRVGD